MKQKAKFRKELVGSTTRALVLSVLNESPGHGYQIAQVIKERSGGKLHWREGTIYPVLHRLEKQGLIEGAWEVERGAGASSKPKRVYHLTRRGRKALKEEKEEWYVFSSLMNYLLGGQLCMK